MWYSYTIEKVLNILNTTKEGLNNKEATQRLEKYGKNELPKPKSDSILKIIFSELINPIVIVLIITIIISFILGEVIDAIAIIFIITVDIALGTYQEYRAVKTADALAKLVSPKAKVLRNNKINEINSTELVIGDIICLESGDKVCADARVLSSENLLVDESILTGESVGVNKVNKFLKEGTPLADRINMVYAGTSILRGRATCVVVETASNTEVGKIANQVKETEQAPSPLAIRISKFSKQICLIILVIAIIMTITFLIKGYQLMAIFSSVIALSVSAMPEGLPLALTMALTISSNRMSKENVIVKKLNSVESLGSCTLIASDKTGTLTINEQTAKKIVLPTNEEFNVTGIGYNEEGIIENINEKVEEIVKLGYINNEAHISKFNNDYELIGDSIDLAFLFLGKKAKINQDDIEILKLIPYESENKCSAVFYKYQDQIHCTIKGSLEVVLEHSQTMQKNRQVKINKELINNQNDNLAKEGYRNIAISDGIVSKITDISQIANLTYKGLVAFKDPIRQTAKQSVKECISSGLKVIMITGDHPLTAYSIAKELGIATSLNEVATGTDLENYYQKSKEELTNFIQKIKVFTRVTPTDKLNIVNCLKESGEFVAVTGDGVNDAPALKSANIGVAMGSGSEVAKETALMIVNDNNFSSVVKGIKEGRAAYANIRKVIYFLISCGLSEVLFFLLSIIFNMEMPLVAIQILWLNIVTDGLQDVALSFETAEDDIMKHKPRSPKEAIFDKSLMTEIILSGTFIGVLVFALWFILIKVFNMETFTARGYVMALMVFIQNMQTLNCCSETNSIFKHNFLKNPFVIISILLAIGGQILIMEVPLLSKLLSTTSIPVTHLLFLFTISTSILLIMEIYKYLTNKIHNN